jgi:hypothetical protein
MVIHRRNRSVDGSKTFRCVLIRILKLYTYFHSTVTREKRGEDEEEKKKKKKRK